MTNKFNLVPPAPYVQQEKLKLNMLDIIKITVLFLQFFIRKDVGLHSTFAPKNCRCKIFKMAFWQKYTSKQLKRRIHSTFEIVKDLNFFSWYIYMRHCSNLTATTSMTNYEKKINESKEIRIFHVWMMKPDDWIRLDLVILVKYFLKCSLLKTKLVFKGGWGKISLSSLLMGSQ